MTHSDSRKANPLESVNKKFVVNLIMMMFDYHTFALLSDEMTEHSSSNSEKNSLKVED